MQFKVGDKIKFDRNALINKVEKLDLFNNPKIFEVTFTIIKIYGDKYRIYNSFLRREIDYYQERFKRVGGYERCYVRPKQRTD
jgi:hypothetical protein